MTEMTVPLKGRFFNGPLWWLAPVFFAALVFVLLQIIFQSMVRWVPLAPGEATPIPAAVVFVRPYAWMSSALLLCMLFLTTILASCLAIWEMRKASFYRWTWQTALFLLTLCMLLAVVTARKAATPVPLLERQIGIFDYRFSGFKRPGSTLLLDILAICESAMITIAFAFVNTQIKVPFATWDEAAVRKQLSLRMRQATILLYLGALTLAIGVVQFNLLLRMPGGNGSHLNLSATEIDALATGLSMYAGTFFTLLLAALFVPTAVHLRGFANAFAESIGVDEQDEKNGWLKELGFATLLSQQLPKIIAVLAPILTGWLGEPLVKAISSL